MMEQSPKRSLPVSIEVGIPLVGAILLTLTLRTLYPLERVDTGVLDPAILAGLFLAAQWTYVNHSLVPAAATDRLLGGVLGIANTLTLLRGALYAVVAGFIVVPPEPPLVWVPAVAYGSGVVLDKLDGLIARSVGEETPLGARLDMAFDTFGFVAAPLVAVRWEFLPVWYLLLSAAKYVYRGGLAWRGQRDQPVYDLPESVIRRYLAGMQMVFLTIALVPVAPRRYVLAVAPFALAASLLVFARDYLVVTGRLSREVT
ncbi:CDP-alcohol phosphatidyltransferase family protein [Halodesulfurarchaeum formicicum]|uniref:CDP-alcohol phosphatidyltransferase family protein n=1 Tax=Halodesulfurarchaeum formicicum TaxID=1873524 RepID=UPI00373FCAD0